MSNVKNQSLSIDDQVEYILQQEGIHGIQTYDIFIRKSAKTHDIDIQINIYDKGHLIEFEYENDNYVEYHKKIVNITHVNEQITFSINNPFLSQHTFASLIEYIETQTGHHVGDDTQSVTATSIYRTNRLSIRFRSIPDCYTMDHAGTVQPNTNCTQ